MRTFIWLLTLAMGIFCFTCWFVADLAMSWFQDSLGNGNALPGVTKLILREDVWFLIVPVPWVIYSIILSSRKELSAQATFVFAGTIAVAATVVLCCLVVAAGLPILPLRRSH